jgi:hypothetical protein
MEMLVVCILFFLLAVLSMLLMNTKKLERIFSRRAAPTVQEISRLTDEAFQAEYNKYRQEALRRGK